MTAFDIVPDAWRTPTVPSGANSDDEHCCSDLGAGLPADAAQTASSSSLPIIPASPAGLPVNSDKTFETSSTAAPEFALDFYQAAVDQAGIAVVGMDTTGIVRTFNHTAARLLGRGAQEVIGKTIVSIVPQEYRVMAGRAMQRTLQQRSVNQFEMELLPPGGKNPLYLAVILNCVLDGHGTCRGVMAWIRDISNRKELETNLTRSRHMAAVGTLAAGVAHHFNNIVCGMNTMVEFALATEDAVTMKRALRMSSEAAARIGYITQSLLAMNCGESEAGVADPDLADLTEELLRFADAVEPTLEKKGIFLKLDLQASRIAAVPKQRFGQVLQHLLKNAEESFADNPPAARAKVITVRTMSQDEQIMLQFSDTGCGIAAENLASIFDPFYSTKSVRCGGNSGNPGLGLTLVHGVVMDMGGHVWADSAPERGTTINMLIPITT